MDEKSVKKVFTIKSGYFRFSSNFSMEELTALLVETTVLYKTVVDLPILPQMSSRLEEELIRRSIFGTAALEGNPLTEEKVGEIISNSNGGVTTERAEKEIWNLKAAYDHVNTIPTSGSPLKITEELIKQIHAIVTHEIEHERNIPGRYRNHKVQVGDSEHGGVYTAPKCLPDIESLMKEYAEWINSDKIMTLDAFLRAPLAHYHLGLIHPFGDGNGRVARLVEALVLRFAGVKYVPAMLSNFYYRNMDEYFLVFSQSRRNKSHDVTAFLKFALRGAVESLNEIKDKITFFIRKFALRDYYNYLRGKKIVTRRQHDFLTTLLESDLKPFTLKDLFAQSPYKLLYRDVTERTGRRDLKRLIELTLLGVTEDKKFALNLRTLG
ncbi:MAG: Fic family protein [Deltaproteobacteria bacterium]|nr:Fic family protein [Deltaproteobacteria bacterium]